MKKRFSICGKCTKNGTSTLIKLREKIIQCFVSDQISGITYLDFTNPGRLISLTIEQSGSNLGISLSNVSQVISNAWHRKKWETTLKRLMIIVGL